MQTKELVRTFSDSFFESLIFNMEKAPLSSVPFHFNSESIERFFSKDFPVHFAIHEVLDVDSAPPEYTEVHVHEDHHEMNAIISRNCLEYKIVLGDKTYQVNSNSSIWIPAGMPHSANVIKGDGFFIAMRIEKSIPIPPDFLLPDFRAMYSM